MVSKNYIIFQKKLNSQSLLELVTLAVNIFYYIFESAETTL